MLRGLVNVQMNSAVQWLMFRGIQHLLEIEINLQSVYGANSLLRWRSLFPDTLLALTQKAACSSSSSVLCSSVDLRSQINHLYE